MTAVRVGSSASGGPCLRCSEKASDIIAAPDALYETRGAHGAQGAVGGGGQRNAKAVRRWHTWPPDVSGDGCSIRCLCARRAAARAARPAPEHRRARRRGRDRYERGKRFGEAEPSSQREETQTDSATCRHDTKFPHKWAQVIVAYAGVSIAQIVSDTP